MNITYFGFLKHVTNHSTLKLLRRLFLPFFVSDGPCSYSVTYDIFSTDIFLFQCTDLMQLLNLRSVAMIFIKDLFLECYDT